MPSRAWYVLAVAIVIGALVAAVWLAVARVGTVGAGLTQIVVPGGADLQLVARGTYTIFHERTSQVDGRLYSGGDVAGLRVAVWSSGAGRNVTLRPAAARSTYNIGGRSGVSLLVFEVDAPGLYRLTAAYDDGRTQPQVVLAVGTGLFSGVLAIIALSGGIALAGTAVALLIFIVVLLRRRRALRGGG
ncbi:MAG TPA: hypothetical protein VJ890_28805 [Vineibacter sp.]|nr:hypothetical protein [Vineibacter sp.]